MASEFGITSDEVITLLHHMDVPVRTHLSVLTDDQVARARARWEREKRQRVEKASSTTTRRRRSAATEDVSPAAGTAKPAKAPRTSRAAKAAPPSPPEPPAEESSPAGRRRRRPASEVAAVAAAQDLAALEAASAAAELDLASAATLPAEETVPGFHTAEAESIAPASDSGGVESAADSTAGASRGAPSPRAGAAFDAPVSRAMPSVERHEPSEDRPRPRPIVPGAPRPKQTTPVPFMHQRPVASAAPGAPGMPTRREDKKSGAGMPGGGRRKKGKRGAVDQEAVTANISKTMTALRGAPVRRGRRSADDSTARDEVESQRVAAVEREKKTVRVNEFIMVSELAEILKVPAPQIVGFAFKNLGLMVTINQRLDFDQIELIAGEFGFRAVREAEYAASPAVTTVDRAEDLRPRPPVVTIMGHVDHGKTSLLDYIRKANVVAGEAGGITQHIGAYHVTLPNRKEITFLDTPGHEAFTAMRARGAQVTDIVVLVVAADDQVMPQTVEAISHAKNAGVPIIVAINKIDLPGANPAKVKQGLLQHDVVVEDFGGATLSTEVSAKKGTNVEALLDQILLQAEILDLKANPNRRGVATVIEARLDPGKGPVATVLVTAGTIHVGDDLICGMYSGRVRALLDERGKQSQDAGPGVPIQVLGLTGVPTAGDQMLGVEDAAESREIAHRRQRLDREAKSRRTTKSSVSLEDFMSHAAAVSGEKRTLRILIKADQGGPAEALADALGQLSNEEVQVEVVHRGVGAITESDILLARAAGAIIVGFHVRPDNNARAAAEREGVDIKLYRVIYEAVADVRAALEGLLRPEEHEVVLGEAEVRELFRVPRIGVVAGCSVRSGVITRQGKIRVIRDSTEVYAGAIASLRRFKDDVREVRDGFECGIGVENFNDLKVGDVIECYRTEEVARTLKPVEQT
jgi:translation initiation factor IF-2